MSKTELFNAHVEFHGMCDENTQFEDWCNHELNEYGYGKFDHRNDDLQKEGGKS